MTTLVQEYLTQSGRVIRARSDEDPPIPVPPGEEPPPPVREPPDTPVIGPDGPVREPGPDEPRRLSIANKLSWRKVVSSRGRFFRSNKVICRG